VAVVAVSVSMAAFLLSLGNLVVVAGVVVVILAMGNSESVGVTILSVASAIKLVCIGRVS
jgi:hypothetical protein